MSILNRRIATLEAEGEGPRERAIVWWSNDQTREQAIKAHLTECPQDAGKEIWLFTWDRKEGTN